ncbi:MAG: fibronectin-binding domain-containing protein, partial [Spirochaetaceae bacterium]|nr:fibronectin-binding domain-containing protein [Spirochaetaceae bacterium]
VPLDLLLDAGNLALSYSKGKSAREADLYYTQVKHLRRPKDGAVGTVLPTQEKNLRITLEPSRLEALKAAAEPA